MDATPVKNGPPPGMRLFTKLIQVPARRRVRGQPRRLITKPMFYIWRPEGLYVINRAGVMQRCSSNQPVQPHGLPEVLWMSYEAGSSLEEIFPKPMRVRDGL